jgi:hypothetical protein
LEQSGWALIAVPITGANTFEDKSITKPADRLRIYDLAEQVRICGIDYVKRLEKKGFMVTIYKTDQVATKDEQIRFGLNDTILYFCTKSGYPK